MTKRRLEEQLTEDWMEEDKLARKDLEYRQKMQRGDGTRGKASQDPGFRSNSQGDQQWRNS